MLPVIFFNKFFGSRLTGNLDLTRQVLAVPLSFLSISISQVYLQRWSEKFNNKQSIIRDFKYLIVFLAGVSLLMLVFIYFFGQWLFPFVFGQKWDLAGKFSEILIFKYSLTFIVSPLTVIFIALKKIKYSSTWQIFYFLIIASLMFFKHLKADAFLTVYVMFDVFSYVLYFVLIWYILIKYEKSLKNAKL
jgi:O-antigen/teichoic acid export membrane protein